MPKKGDPKVCCECGYEWKGQFISRDCDSFLCDRCARIRDNRERRQSGDVYDYEKSWVNRNGGYDWNNPDS